MDILILCIGSLAATAVAWLYLAVQENQPEKTLPETCRTECADEKAEIVPASQDAAPVFSPPKGKRLAFLTVMLLSLCGIAVALELIFDGNTLVENGRLMTLLAILFVAANVDARQQIIPNAIVAAGLVLRIVFWFLELFTVPGEFWGIMKSDLTACLLVVAFFVVGVLLVKGGIGMGDIKLMLVMCLFQGFYGVVSSLFCSLLVAFVYAIGVLIMRKKTRKDSVTFAPAILIGTLFSIFLTGM